MQRQVSYIFLAGFFSLVQPPTLTVEINGTEKPYLGSDIAIICEIQLTGDVEVETSVRWLKGKNNVTGIPNTITVTDPTCSGSHLQSVLKFHPLLSYLTRGDMHVM